MIGAYDSTRARGATATASCQAPSLPFPFRPCAFATRPTPKQRTDFIPSLLQQQHDTQRRNFPSTCCARVFDPYLLKAPETLSCQYSDLLIQRLETYSPAPSTTMSDYASLKVPDLKKLLSERGLPQSGNKADLIARLQENDKSTSFTTCRGRRFCRRRSTLARASTLFPRACPLHHHLTLR